MPTQVGGTAKVLRQVLINIKIVLRFRKYW